MVALERTEPAVVPITPPNALEVAALSRPLPVPLITEEQIDAAMGKAVEIVRPAIVAPRTVDALPLHPLDAMGETKHWREMRWSDGAWCLVGYVSAHGEHGYWPSWAVWWDSETDRVWLKREGW